jgi:hypothetical protein
MLRPADLLEVAGHLLSRTPSEMGLDALVRRRRRCERRAL